MMVTDDKISARIRLGSELREKRISIMDNGDPRLMSRVAQIGGLTPNQVGDIERGGKAYTVDSLIRYLSGVGLDLAGMIGGAVMGGGHSGKKWSRPPKAEFMDWEYEEMEISGRTCIRANRPGTSQYATIYDDGEYHVKNTDDIVISGAAGWLNPDDYIDTEAMRLAAKKKIGPDWKDMTV